MTRHRYPKGKRYALRLRVGPLCIALELELDPP